MTTIMKMVQCPICLEECRVPVEVTCFSCYRMDAIHCHSLIRFCRHCCITLFELEKPLQERREYLKCLFCDAWCNPQTLMQLPFRVDFFSIRNNEIGPVRCPHCMTQIPTHYDLEKHVFSNCLLSPTHLCECGEYLINPILHHCIWCSICNVFVYDKLHLLYAHDMKFCGQCQKFTELDLNIHMEKECLARIMTCKYCKNELQALYFPSHLLAHLEESKERCRMLDEIIEKEKLIQQRILLECNTSFNDIYNESLVVQEP